MLISLVPRLDLGDVAADAVVAVVDEAVHRVPVVRELHADDDVGLGDHSAGRPRGCVFGKFMRLPWSTTGACRSSASSTRQFDAVRRARRAIDHDHRPLGIGEQPRGFVHRAGIALRRRAGEKFRNVELLAVIADRLGLQAAVERHHHRAIRRRGRDLVHAHERLREMLRRHRRVVPLGIVAHDRVDVLGGMEGRHARRALRGVEIVAAHDDDGNAVAPGVVDRHGGVLQPDHAVDQRHQRLAGRLEVAVAHRDAGLLVHAGEEFRHRVLAVIDQRLVDAAIARGRIGRQVFDVERLDHVDHEIGTGRAVVVRRQRRRAGLGGGDMGIRRQRRRQPLLRFRRGGGFGGVDGAAGAGDGSRGEEFSAVEPQACILFGHLVSP